ncbi:class I SAM-dependent methyltransferase [Roseibium sp. RKSG952]|uniref:class I SAM-dependent methyltransferase n=1 Tax=Roseibium sp. RKSG952 TaxID=2529384 RepID=UPI0012BBE2DB|nr:class I SAM-dependent methyltransferase [Roseibium sp. RKSG952]MTH99886.1 class I SAM-dependent methyltransferase [Roseibium sp. RKSG952]
MSDPALDALVLPIENGFVDLPEPARVLFSRARAGRALTALGRSGLVCEQSFAPDRDALQAAGHDVTAETRETGFDAVLLLPGRQRQEARAQLARAVAKAKPGAVILAAAPNTEGAKSLETDFGALLGTADKLSKHKCRVLWAEKDGATLDPDLLESWQALDAVRPVLDGAYLSRPGVFAWDRIDPASALLAQHLPDTLSGKGADLGAGFGFLTRTVLENAPKVSGIDVYEAEKRALDLAEQNLAAFKGKKTLTGIWSDVTRGIEGLYDFIVSNPPFHQTGKADRPDTGQGFIRSAARGLKPGGSFWMVANRHLPYEHALSEAFASFEIIADEGGYKVIRAIKGKGH